MKPRLIKKVAAAVALLGCCCLSHAEDIDLFVSSPPDADDLPNVLFIVDNTGNWSAPFNAEKAALASVFQGLKDANGNARYNVGVMFFAETGNENNNVSGGYVRAALRPMNATNAQIYSNMISALNVQADRGNAGVSSLAMAEAYRYFSGGAPYAGNNKAKADYAGNTGSDWSPSVMDPASLAAMRSVYALGGNALASKGATAYNWPAGSQCGRNYIIYISNGAAQDNAGANGGIPAANAMLQAAGGNTTPIPLSPNGSQNNVMDEWARFLKSYSGLNVTTYAIDVDPKGNGSGPGWTRLLKSMSNDYGGGRYYAVTSGNGGAAIQLAVKGALDEIRGVNSVFASVSLPISANTQNTYSNQVYIGLFRPDSQAYPRWNGNLKQYQLGYLSSGGPLRLLDADEQGAIHNLTGFIRECARSFWTPTSPDSYWSFRPSGDYEACTTLNTATDYLISNFPDGNIVEKGGQGYMLRASSTRVPKTCSPGIGCTTLSNFDTSNADISIARLGAANATERTQLINWARGLDIDDENGDGSSTTMRPSVHADVVHSRPVAVDFGSTGAPKVVVFYGGNDGVFRAINGNQSAGITGTGSEGTVAAGGEIWGFVPPEFYDSIKRLRDNSVKINFPQVSVAGARPKPYGMDGPITAYRDSSKTLVFATMRRGGRAVYAFEVDNANPLNITLKWRKGCPENFPISGIVSDIGCDTGFSAMGQTWSAAKPVMVPGYGSPVVIMGGGYDTCEDSDPHACTGSTKGNKIYVLDAYTGALLNTGLNTDRGVVADISIVPDNTTGYAKLAYAADLGGNVYRLDTSSGAPSTWTLTKIASLGCSTGGGTCTPNRKFMFAPDVLEDNGEYILLLGSGDREKPLLYYSSAAGVSNYFFMLRDRPSDNTWLTAEQTTCGGAVLCLDSLASITTSENPADADLAVKKGWYLGLRSTEQVVTSAITIFGTVSFSTHTPDVPQLGQCTARLGVARVYNISYRNAESVEGTPDRSEELPPDTGLPPSPVAGMVQLVDGEAPVAFCIGCTSESSIEAEQPEVPAVLLPTQPKGRVYWYIQR